MERVHRSAWEAQGPAVLHGGSIDRAGRLTMAYNALEDVGFLMTEEGRDFTTGHDAEFLDSTLVPLMYEGLREVGSLADVAPDEIENRIQESKRATLGPS
jgi:hypothetical protein